MFTCVEEALVVAISPLPCLARGGALHETSWHSPTTIHPGMLPPGLMRTKIEVHEPHWSSQAT